ncbi:MAG: FAD synthetase family protein [Treponema sp.]|nr:FAD synthetase family protein [Treponema sp.]
MQIIDFADFLENGIPLENKKSAVTVGVFDGVHLGHQKLINNVVSHDLNLTPVVVTFKENHKIGSENIQSFEERTAALEKLGIKIMIVIDFTQEFKRMPGVEFLKILLKRGSIGYFAVGEDFSCGYQLDTDAKAIKTFFESHNIAAGIVQDVMEDSLPVSSSRIREAIAAGNIKLAEKMLGYALKERSQ